MDSNLIHHSSPAENMKCLFLYYIQHLMLARLLNGLKPHLPPSSAKKMKWSFLDYIQLLMIGRLVDGLKPHPPPLFSQKMKSSFLDYFQLLIISQAGQWTRTPSATPLQPIKWNASFWIVFTSDDQPGWSMDSNPICHPPPAKKWNATFWVTFNFLWLAGLVNGLKPHPPPLSSQ